jgi:peroxiredoxin Q/BCP
MREGSFMASSFCLESRPGVKHQVAGDKCNFSVPAPRRAPFSLAMTTPSRPSPGQPAPDFTASVVGGDYPAGASLTLSELRGRPVLLYFYPKDDTPGCTKQACALRDGWADISARAAVFGVSADSAASHDKFIKKFSLPFPLLVDEGHAIADKFGVWVEKSMYGKKYFGMERTSFLIAADGSVQAVFPKVKPDEHLKLVLKALG